MAVRARARPPACAPRLSLGTWSGPVWKRPQGELLVVHPDGRLPVQEAEWAPGQHRPGSVPPPPTPPGCSGHWCREGAGVCPAGAPCLRGAHLPPQLPVVPVGPRVRALSWVSSIRFSPKSLVDGSVNGQLCGGAPPAPRTDVRVPVRAPLAGNDMRCPARPTAFSVLSRVAFPGTSLVVGPGQPDSRATCPVREGGALLPTPYPRAGVKVLSPGGRCLVSDTGSASPCRGTLCGVTGSLRGAVCPSLRWV